MRTPYLSKKNSGWQIQMRLPVAIDPELKSSPIRIIIKPVKFEVAKRVSFLVVGVLLSIFDKVIAMRRSNGVSEGGAREYISQQLNEILPTLMAMALLDGNGPSPSEALVSNVFDTAALLGAVSSELDRPMTPRFDVANAAALKSPEIAELLFGHSSPQEAISAIPTRSEIASKDSEIASLENALYTFSRVEAKRAMPTSEPVSKPPKRFSELLEEQIKRRTEEGPAARDIVGIYIRVGAEFLDIVGDKAIGEYSKSDLQKYADEISWLPNNYYRSEKRRPLRQAIAENKAARKPGLARKTVLEGRVAHLKAIYTIGCDDERVANGWFGRKITAPKHARPPKRHIKPAVSDLQFILESVVDNNGLTASLLFLLAALTGRRVGLLTNLYRDDVVMMGDACVIDVETHRITDGVNVRNPTKTEASRSAIIIPNVLRDAGFYQWAKSASGPLFPDLMACVDPADTAQKRVNRIIAQLEEKKGIKHFTFHGFRGLRLDISRENELPTYLIQFQLGHARQTEHDKYADLTVSQAETIAAQSDIDSVNWDFLERVDFSDPQLPTAKKRRVTPVRRKAVRRKK